MPEDTVLNFNKIDNRIFVYKNPFNDLEKIVSSLADRKWDQWYTFGDIHHIPLPGSVESDLFPDIAEWESYTNKIKDKDKDLDIVNVFYNTTKHYIEETGLTSNNWMLGKIDIAKYPDAKSISDPNAKPFFNEIGKNYTMSFHTDYPQESTNSPGAKQIVTCNMYLNDNYDGGEIEFKVFSEDGSYERITYKPEAGDVVIFPSTPPYWHGVRETTNGDKYFVRSFWYVIDGPSEEWLENEKKYGKEVWHEMEETRKQEERISGLYIRNG
jgi:hypothetical protein